MSEKEIRIDPVSLVFAKVMKIGTWVGLTIMVVCGLLYLVGISPYLDTSSMAKHWGEPAAEFWKNMKGTEVNDYSWFLSHLNSMDSLSMVGISFLALTPLISVVLIIPRAKKIYAILLSILVAEFIFCILRPLI